MTTNAKLGGKVVWLTSYPKCGATWTQGIVRQAGISYGVPQNDLDVYKLIAFGEKPIASAAVKSDITSDKCAILKTHRSWDGSNILHRELPLEMVAFVHVLRNPLDMLLSYINFTKIQFQTIRDKGHFQKTFFIDFLGFENPLSYEAWLEMKLEDIPKKNLDIALANFTKNNLQVPSLKLVEGNWFEFNISWRKAAEQFPSVTIRFEDSIKDYSSFLPLTNIFKFSEEEVLQAAANIKVARMKTATDTNLKVFYNKMSSYYYLDFFSPTLINDFINKYHMELKLLGYADLPQVR